MTTPDNHCNWWYLLQVCLSNLQLSPEGYLVISYSCVGSGFHVASGSDSGSMYKLQDRRSSACPPHSGVRAIGAILLPTRISALYLRHHGVHFSSQFTLWGFFGAVPYLSGAGSHTRRACRTAKYFCVRFAQPESEHMTKWGATAHRSRDCIDSGLAFARSGYQRINQLGVFPVSRSNPARSNLIAVWALWVRSLGKAKALLLYCIVKHNYFHCGKPSDKD